MLFKKQETFSNDFEFHSCVVKYDTENSSFVFKQSLWYIYHFDEFEFWNGLMWCLNDAKAFVQTNSNGMNDGLVDARTDDITLTVVGKAILFPIEYGGYGDGLVYGKEKKLLKIISNAPVYCDIEGISLVGRYSEWSYTDISKHVATALNGILSRNLLIEIPGFEIVGEKGIKSGQFIL